MLLFVLKLKKKTNVLQVLSGIIKGYFLETMGIPQKCTLETLKLGP